MDQKNRKIKEMNEKVNAIKEIAFCKCLINGFPLDSLDKKDPYVYALVDMNSLCLEILDETDSLAKRVIGKLPTGSKVSVHSEGVKKRRIMIDCLYFYESKALAEIARKLYLKHKSHLCP